MRACYLLFNTGLLDESKRMSKIDSPVDTCREATKTEEGSFLNKEDSQTYTSGSVASPGTELCTYQCKSRGGGGGGSAGKGRGFDA